MAKIFKKRSSIRLPKQKKILRSDEWGKAGKGLVVCKRCHNLFYKKGWHHPNGRGAQPTGSGSSVHFKICPACTMIGKNLYEGEIIIEKVPARFEFELVHLITGFGARATKRDPQDRIIEVKKQKNGYRVTTTENQLAVKLAKKIKAVFNHVDVSISYSDEPYEVSRVRVTFI